MPDQSTNIVKQFARQTRRTLADFWLNVIHPRTVQIGITGSYGKTSTTHAIYAILSAHADTLVTDVNLDTIYNIPITALRLRNHAYAVFEMGIDTLNEMSLHLEIVSPDVSIITGIAPVHADADHLGSVENIIREKRKIIEVLSADQLAILNGDDHNVRNMASHTRAQILWYGLTSNCDYRAEDLIISTDGMRFMAVTPHSRFEVNTGVLGRHNAANIMAAIAVADYLGIPIETRQQALATMHPLKGRLNIEEGPRGSTLINDALRANTASTRAGLEFLSDLTTPGKKIAVLGEMGEIGETAIEEHYDLGRYLTTLDVDLTVCVSGLTRHTHQGAADAGQSRVYFVETVQEAAEVIAPHLTPHDILYLKGSLLKHLERVKLILTGVEVVCTVVSCPFYHQCDGCQYRVSGYQEH